MQNVEVKLLTATGMPRIWRLEIRAPQEVYGYLQHNGEWTELGKFGIADDLLTLDDCENFLRETYGNRKHAIFSRY